MHSNVTDRKMLSKRQDFFLRKITLTDLAILNNVLYAREQQDAETIAALENATRACEDSCDTESPDMQKELKKTRQSIRRLKLIQRSIPRMLRASMQATVEHNNPTIGFANEIQFNVVKDDNIVDLVQSFFSTLRVTMFVYQNRLVLWSDTNKHCICRQYHKAADSGAVVHICVNTAENPRVISFTLWLAVEDGKPEVTASVNQFNHEYGTFYPTESSITLKFAHIRCSTEGKQPDA